jgi:hypothetical protein
VSHLSGNSERGEDGEEEEKLVANKEEIDLTTEEGKKKYIS